MNKRIVTTTAGAAAAVVALGGVAVLTVQQDSAAQRVAQVSAAKRKPAKPGDFNGDGRRDTVALSAQGDVPGYKGRAGFGTVIYTGPKGPSPAGRQIVTDRSVGQPFKGYFSGGMASADFDRDGYADLVVGSGYEKNVKIIIVYGGPHGLTGRRAVIAAPADSGATVGDFNGNGLPDLLVAGSGRTYTIYPDVRAKPGRGIKTTVTGKGITDLYQFAVGDFNGDHRDDLSIVVARDDGDDDDIPAWGELRLGTPKGLGARKNYGKKGIGFSGDAGDINGDGRADLVAQEEYGTKLFVRLGTKAGFGAAKVIPLGREAESLSIGDLNGDGRADVAAGFQSAKVAGKAYAGAVGVLFGGKAGLNKDRMKVLDLSSPGVPGDPKLRGWFGSSVVLADLDGDGLADLTTGTPTADSPTDKQAEGRLYFFKGSRGGFNATGLTTLGTRDLGIYRRYAELGSGLMD